MLTTGALPAPTAVPFSGSYDRADCLFLLKPLHVATVSVEDKERLIQSRQRHYSELLAPEHPPTSEYTRLFRELTHRHAARLAAETVSLAAWIAAHRPEPLVMVSLARAGTPIGALLARALRWRLGRRADHYSLSIVRDRGIDENALRYLLRVARHAPASLVFVDGWTAKGVIARELKTAIACWNAANPEQLDDRLHVVADLGGCADVAATYDDYAIPCGIMNATVSGLVSRSLLNDQIGPGDFHGCVFYRELAPYDYSRWFLDRVSRHFPRARPQPLPVGERDLRGAATRDWLRHYQDEHGVADANLIKPGVAEATRVLLRRVPERLLLRNLAGVEVRHLLELARLRDVPIVPDPALPFEAVALIRGGSPPAETSV